MANDMVDRDDRAHAPSVAALRAYQRSNTPLCPTCGSATGVQDGRMLKNGIYRRRRECRSCALRFSTYELSNERFHELRRDRDAQRERAEKAEMALSVLRGHMQGRARWARAQKTIARLRAKLRRKT